MLELKDYAVGESVHESPGTIVFRGLRKKDNLPVILKTLRHEYPSPKETMRLSREFEITRELGIPGVVASLDLVPYHGSFVLVKEDFGGQSLASLLRKVKLSLDGFFHVTLQLTETLGELHQRRIIHKDVNPTNIIVNPATLEAKLTDFGIASLSRKERTAGSGVLEGTLAYISPEQTGRMNRSVDSRSDLYSLGVTMYQMLTTQLPFTVKDQVELVHSHIARRPMPPIAVDTMIPRVLSDIVMKLLAKTAEDRYQSAFGLKSDLEKCLGQWKQFRNIDLFELGDADFSERFQIAEELYGREPEIQTLTSVLESVMEGRREVLLVTGDPGIGKSSLVYEVQRQLARKRGYFVSGKFDQYRRNIPYASLIQALQDLIRQILTEGEEQLKYWQDRLLEALAPNAKLIAEVIPEIELIIGTQPPVPPLSPAEAQNRFRLVFQKFTSSLPAREHPVIIFLDDLQWADRASLDLLQYLITSSATPYFLNIGAYRDNEVDAAHPLTAAIEAIEAAGVKLHRVSVQPLQLADVTDLISDSLHCTEEAATPLAELVLGKTGGNPFFVNQFLHSLYEEELLTADRVGREWRWDLDQIRRRDITDNVVELMTEKLKRLPENTQQALKLAACIGNPFDLSALATVRERTLEETFADLFGAFSEGLVWPMFKDFHLLLAEKQIETDTLRASCRFAHDRIQQAAYSLISTDERQIVHRQIGELLLRSTPAEKLDQRTFDIVNQFNLSGSASASEAVRGLIAELNLKAGRKAQASAAYQSAFNYFAAGLECLHEEDWETRYQIALALHVETAEAAYLSGDFHEMERLSAEVLERSRTLEDRVRIYEIKLRAYIAQARYEEVVVLGLRVLRMLGEPLPANPNLGHIAFEILRARIKLTPKRLEAITELPTMTDPLKLAAMRVTFLLGTAAYFVRPNMAALTALRPLILALNNGVSPITASSFIDYGIILCAKLGDIDAAYRACTLGLRLIETLQATEFETRSNLLFNALIRHWKDHARDSLRAFWGIFHKGLETGDFNFAGMAVYQHLVFSYHCGVGLEQLEEERPKCLQALKPLNQKSTSRTVAAMLQMILNLRGRSADPRLLAGEEFDETAMIPVLQEEKDTIALYDVYLHKAILEFHFGDCRSALENLKRSKEQLDTLGAIDSAVNNMYESLSRLALCSNATPTERSRHLRRVRANQKTLRKWAVHAPMNHQHKYELVEAELARSEGKDLRAMDCYERSIGAARKNQYIQEEALANEMAARFYLDRGQERAARAHMEEARYLYQTWGALAKVRALERQHGSLLDSMVVDARRGEGIINEAGSSGEEALDFLSVLKASQAISGEIDLEKLLSKMITIVVENAGAQKGCLVLEKGGRLVIEAEGNVESSEVKVLRSLTLESHPDHAPASIVHYVLRTRDNVVLNDATRESRFANDPYILNHRPRSVLCKPIIKQGALAGILYLENALTPNAFTPERLEILDILSSQIAVALENASLYQEMKRLNKDLAKAARELEDSNRNLEAKVAQRTKELSARNEELANTLRRLNETQAQLITQEKLASLGHLTAGIAHEIKNPLNFVNNFAELSLELIDEMREHLAKQPSPDDGERRTFEDLLNDLEQNSRKINQHGQRADSIVRSMLQHSRGGSSERQRVEINPMLDENVSLAYHGMRAQDPEFNVTIQKDYDPSVGAVTVVPQDVSRVFLNIIANSFYEVRRKRADGAHDFLPTLSVTTKNLGQVAEVRIRDNGNGIPEHIRDKVFSPFFTTKAAGEGTGLGLSLSYDIIVKGHRGELRFETENGQFTEFIIRLPREV